MTRNEKNSVPLSRLDSFRSQTFVSIEARLILKDSNAISDDPELEKSYSFFIEATSKGQSLTPELSAIIRNIWANPKAKEAIRASRRFQEHSTFLEYLLDSLARVAAPRYIPTDSDIILCNLPPPPPITEMPFSYPDRNSLPPTLVRVRHNIGLQRKWIHLFSDAEAIIFIVDLTCYDQNVYSADTDEHLVGFLLSSSKFLTYEELEPDAGNDASVRVCL
jgi:hypothetical protein